jgi:hypothetical protein
MADKNRFIPRFKYFNPVMALAGGLILGSIVFFINDEHGFGSALVAALKQGFYTAVAGGFITKLCENIAMYYKSDMTAKIMAVLIPSIIAVGLTLILHLIKGTPEPFASTIPTIILAPPGFAWLGNKARNQFNKKSKNDD